jgi:hypothetical protein
MDSACGPRTASNAGRVRGLDSALAGRVGSHRPLYRKPGDVPPRLASTSWHDVSRGQFARLGFSDDRCRPIDPAGSAPRPCGSGLPGQFSDDEERAWASRASFQPLFDDEVEKHHHPEPFRKPKRCSTLDAGPHAGARPPAYCLPGEGRAAPPALVRGTAGYAVSRRRTMAKKAVECERGVSRTTTPVVAPRGREPCSCSSSRPLPLPHAR